MTYTIIQELLQCPDCGVDLTQAGDSLICNQNQTHRYPIVNGIVRFVNPEIGDDYNTHWTEFSKNPISQTKLAQAENFVNWLVNAQDLAGTSRKVFLDVGCGDGNHIPFLPEDAIKIVIDYSGSVDLVANRYQKVKNLFVMQADAQHLPLKNSVVDYLISYSCFNHLPAPKKGVYEASRVLKKGGVAGIWGYSTNNSFIVHGLNIVRKTYKMLGNEYLRRLLAASLVPSLFIVKNSTNMRLGKNSFKECMEIVSTNLSPDHVHILYKRTWKDFCPDGLEYIADYGLPCGQKFRKK